MQVTETPFLDRQELSERWRMSVRTLETWSRQDRGPKGKRFGKKVMYRLEDVQKFEEETFSGGDAA